MLLCMCTQFGPRFRCILRFPTAYLLHPRRTRDDLGEPGGWRMMARRLVPRRRLSNMFGFSAGSRCLCCAVAYSRQPHCIVAAHACAFLPMSAGIWASGGGGQTRHSFGDVWWHGPGLATSLRIVAA